MTTKSQALEIIRLCSEGVSYADQARHLNMPYAEVRNAAQRMAQAGIPIVHPIAARRAKPENREKYEALAAYKLQRKLDKEAKTRKGQIIAMRRDGLDMREIGRRLGISGPRVYQLIAKYRKEGVSLPSEANPAAAAEKRAIKLRTKIDKAQAKWEERCQRNEAKDRVLLAKLGIPITL